ncbi:MAG: hypothetical protein Ct9H300mP19_11190 [Dehalococcoidia bacterium]|nr:MAG: hypothetical protein Ct9H300mP19_11190 [Dehalococcoidia bacterium]
MTGKPRKRNDIRFDFYATRVGWLNEKQIPTQVPLEFHPTPADAVERSKETGKYRKQTEAVPDKSTGDAIAGEQLFSDNGCTACHSTGEEKS